MCYNKIIIPSWNLIIKTESCTYGFFHMVSGNFRNTFKVNSSVFDADSLLFFMNIYLILFIFIFVICVSVSKHFIVSTFPSENQMFMM